MVTNKKAIDNATVRYITRYDFLFTNFIELRSCLVPFPRYREFFYYWSKVPNLAPCVFDAPMGYASEFFLFLWHQKSESLRHHAVLVA